MGYIAAPIKNWREPVCRYLPVEVAERAGHTCPYITLVSGAKVIRHGRTIFATSEEAAKNQVAPAAKNQGRKPARPRKESSEYQLTPA
jgi:hypothetical protein